jgi:guanylate cyclase
MSDSKSRRLPRLSEKLLSFGEYPGEGAEDRGRRRIMVGAVWFSLPFVTLAGLDGPADWVRVLDFGKAFLHLGGLLVLRRFPRRFRPVLHGIFAGDVATDVAITVLLGGFFASGLQVGWSLIAVLGALVAFSMRAAAFWFLAFVSAVVVAAASSSFVEPRYVLSDPQADGASTIIGVTILVFIVMAYFVRQRDRYQRQSDDLLHNILPEEIAAQLKDDSGMIAEQFEEVTVLFADVVNFTPMSAAMSPTELVGLLNTVFTDIDEFVEEMGLEKIKTIGDEYMVAAGVPAPMSDHAHVMAELALRIRDHVASRDFGGHRISFRIGINSGPVVAGIIGKRKFAYDLWGDVVNTASRMESHGSSGGIQISAETYQRVKDRFICERRGMIEVKGKGRLETWFLVGPRSAVPGLGGS